MKNDDKIEWKNDTAIEVYELDPDNHSYVVDEKNALVLISKASECIVNDKVICISKGTKYTILKSSIAQEMESLLHYIEWRLENSYALIVWKTIKFAEEINKREDVINELTNEEGDEKKQYLVH